MCKIADKGSSFVSVTFTPDDWRLAIPGDPVRVNVKLFCVAHNPLLRITSVSLKIIVPSDNVRSVEPQNLSNGERVVSVQRTEKVNRGMTGGLGIGIKFGKAWWKARGTKETVIQRTGEEAISFDIQGDVVGDTALWSVRNNGALGIHGKVEGLSFTLGMPPGEILYSCSVSAQMDGESTVITRHVTSKAQSRSLFPRFANGKQWLSFLGLVVS